MSFVVMVTVGRLTVATPVEVRGPVAEAADLDADPAPDHDTFVLTAMLVSARVRYSACPTLEPRLTSQQRPAEAVFAQITRLLTA